MDYKEKEIDLSNNIIKLNANKNFFTYLFDNVNYQIFQCFKILFNIDIKSLLSNIAFL